MEKTYEEFRIFKKRSEEELKIKYFLKLDEKYKKLKDLKREARYGTKKITGIFSELVGYMIYFAKYLTKLYELTEIENPDDVFNKTRIYFNEIAESIDAFEGMKKISNLYIHDVRKIYSFYNRFCGHYNLQRVYFGRRDTGTYSY